MKKSFAKITLAAALCGLVHNASAQLSASVLTNFLSSANSSGDSELSSLASQLTGKAQALETSAGTNSALSGALNSSLSSLTGGNYSSALTSALGLASTPNLSSGSVGLSKQVGNLATAYIVQKNFSSLAGSETDVTNAVTALASGSISQAVPPIKNIAANTNCTAVQKELIYSVATNYVPGYAKLNGAVSDVKNGLKKFGF